MDCCTLASCRSKEGCAALQGEGGRLGNIQAHGRAQAEHKYRRKVYEMPVGDFCDLLCMVRTVKSNYRHHTPAPRALMRSCKCMTHGQARPCLACGSIRIVLWHRIEHVLRLQVTEIWRPKDANAVMFVWDGTDAKPYASRWGMISTLPRGEEAWHICSETA